jgi:hypothetical protein
VLHGEEAKGDMSWMLVISRSRKGEGEGERASRRAIQVMSGVYIYSSPGWMREGEIWHTSANAWHGRLSSMPSTNGQGKVPMVIEDRP